MNIVYTSYFGNLIGHERIGGLKVITLDTAKKISERGHNVLLICPGKNSKLKKIGPKLEMLEIESIPGIDLMLPIVNKQNEVFLFENLAKFKPEIIHAQDLSACGIWVQKWANENKVPFIITFHMIPSDILDFGINEHIPFLYDIQREKKRNKINGTTQLVYKEFLDNAQGIIALNISIMNDLLKYTNAEKIRLIPNGVDIGSYENLSTKHDSNVLIFTGMLSQRKNQRYLIKVQQNLLNTELYLVGSALTYQYEVSLKKYIQKHAVQNVHFVSNISRDEVKKYIEKTKVFVSASTKEVQSLSVIEGLASGKPVVALANETTEELINDTVGKLLPISTTPAIFAQEVKKIMALTPKQYNQMSNNCRARVKELDWSIVVNKLENFYAESIASKVKITPKKNYKSLLVYSAASAVILGLAWTLKNISKSKNDQK